MGITDMDAYRERRDTEQSPHLAGMAVCLGCRLEWAAVTPVGCVSELDCPECRTHRGVMKATCAPPEGVDRFECSCGCQVFSVTIYGALCILCGEERSFSELAEQE